MKKSLNDYEMWEILEDPELTEEYKKSHQFLDDMYFWSFDQPGRVQGIGYSPIWNILEVDLIEKNIGKDTLLYSEAEEWLVDQFKVCEDPDHYFSTFIEGYLTRLFI